MSNLTIFDIMYKNYIPKNKIRLIEFFAGYGSQSLALKYLNIPFEHWKICKWAVKSIQAYKDLHFEDKTYNSDLSKEEYVDYLYKKGISSNYNEPMTYEQIKRLNEKQLKTIYDNIKITNNLVNIQQVKGEDLEIVNTDEYDYILTYSFPCQDLSLAGKGKGMSDTSTRSGMLWEVERILTECYELGTMPKILLMENVPQVHGSDNVNDFNKWQLRLEELGYKNYFQDLIATDYGIPQTRNRCFMLSILGDYNYTFPKPIPLKLRLKDILEKEVDEKYFLSDKQIKDIQKWKAYEKPLETIGNAVSKTLTTRIGAYSAGMQLTTNGTIEEEINLKRKLCNELVTSGLVKENDVIRHSYTKSRFNDWDKRNVEQNNISPTLDTRCDCLGIAVPENTKKGYAIATDGDGIYINRPHQKRGVVQKDKIQTIKTNCDDIGVVTKGLRIRKLTPREVFRLMGVKDEDFEKVRKNQSDMSLYHLAGDSIVVNVLMAIFGELFNIDWRKYNE